MKLTFILPICIILLLKSASTQDTPGLSPIESRMAKFPISKIPDIINFSQVAYMRAEKESCSINHKTDSGHHEAVTGYILHETKLELSAMRKKILREKIVGLGNESATNDQRRPWAGGVRIRLIAFAKNDVPMFLCDLQTTTPTEVSFRKLYAVDKNTVRSDAYDEYFNSFYFEIDDATVAATLFAIASEIFR
jgi:hypothetical protein